MMTPAFRTLERDSPIGAGGFNAGVFPSYPYEWPAEMLYAAGLLILDLAESKLRQGLVLKSASADIRFDGARPLFSELPSFQSGLADPFRHLYHEFRGRFVIPLLIEKFLGMEAPMVLRAFGDRVRIEALRSWIGPARRLQPRWLTDVTLPEWTNRLRAGLERIFRERAVGVDPAEVSDLLRQLRKQLRSAAPDPSRTSPWCRYHDGKRNYSLEQRETKRRLVAAFLNEMRPSSVLDVGCNCGTFATMAARSGARVVAIDSDATAIGQLWQQASKEALAITPLVVDILRPTPDLRWRNQTYPSFISRAREAFDAVLVLATIHHLIASGLAPLSEIVDLIASLTTRFALVEFILPSDPVFTALLNYSGVSAGEVSNESFLTAARPFFDVIGSAPVTPTRTLYTLVRKS